VLTQQPMQSVLPTQLPPEIAHLAATNNLGAHTATFTPPRWHTGRIIALMIRQRFHRGRPERWPVPNFRR
jgi:hypothetical protein